MRIFANVRYHLASSLPQNRQLELSTVLQGNGATPADSLDQATHVISNSHRFEGWQSAGEEVAVVTDIWVDRSMILGKLQGVHYYSADPAMIFSGIVACATELPPSDLEVLSAGITALGGQWRTGLTKDVTHLFALTPESNKYHTALHFQEHTKVKVLLPHWFDDAVRLGLGALPTGEYEWPDPKLLRGPEDGEDRDQEGGKVLDPDALKKQKKIDADKRLLYRTALWTHNSAVPPPSGRDVWQGRKIMLSPSLELVGGRREAVEVGIERSGGVVVEFESKNGDGDVEEETRRVDEADILVTRWRNGKAYFRAVRAEKLVGSLHWLFHVQSTGVLAMPVDQLLHYPIPKRPIEGFSGHEITVTNYTGEAREYIKRLIAAMGARFTPSMSGKNTVLIAAYISGTKTTKALSWSIPIVNHTWLEDCFIKWRNLTVGLEKYVVFPPGVDFASLLGERGVGRGVEVDLEGEEGEDDEGEKILAEVGGREQEKEKWVELDGQQMEVDAGTSPARREPIGLESSARDVREVEDVVSAGVRLFDPGPDVGMDVHPNDGDGMDVDEEKVEPKPASKKSGAASKPKVTPKPKPKAKSSGDASTPASKQKSTAGPAKKGQKVDEGRSSKSDSESDAEERAVHVRTKDVSTPKKAKRAVELSGGNEEGEELEREEDEEPIVRPVERLIRRGGNKINFGVDYDEDEVEIRRSARKVAIGADGAVQNGGTHRKRGKDGEDEDDEESEVEVRMKEKARGKERVKEASVRSKEKAKVVAARDDTSSEESEVEVKAKRRGKDAGTKSKSKAKTMAIDDTNSEESEVEVLVKGKGKKVVSGKGKGKAKAMVDTESEESEVEVLVKAKGKASAKSKGKAKATAHESEESEFEVRMEETGATAKKGAVGKAAVADTWSEESDAGVRMKETEKKGASAKSKKKTKVITADSESEEEPKVSTKKANATTKSTRTRNRTETVEPNPSVESPTKPQANATPKRTLSVMMPPLTLTKVSSASNSQLDDRTAAESSVGRKRVGAGLARTESLRAAADERGNASGSGRPSVKGGESLKSGTSPVSSVGGVPSSILARSSKRNAATKATQRLRDEIMPDVMNYQQEMRKARKSGGIASGDFGYAGVANGSAGERKKKRESAPFGESEEEVQEEREKKRRKVGSARADKADVVDDGNAVSSKGKQKQVAPSEDSEDESPPPAPTKKTPKKAVSKKVGGVEAVTSSGSKGNRKPGSKNVKLLTTQVTLSDEVVKVLTKLGVKITTRPSECTHLLAPHLVRTEKFLCALAVAPFILTAKWALESAAAKQILNEDDYLLHDRENEAKYNFKLSEALLRAKEINGRLFEKKTFYVTPKVPIDIKLLKNVVAACGGQVTTQTPTVRIINASPDRHVISCPADASIWRPIAQHHPIYTQELLLTGALKQDVDWETDTHKVPGSY